LILLSAGTAQAFPQALPAEPKGALAQAAQALWGFLRKKPQMPAGRPKSLVTMKVIRDFRRRPQTLVRKKSIGRARKKSGASHEAPARTGQDGKS
jgi:hypothetical protein